MLRKALVATLAAASLSALFVPVASGDTFVRIHTPHETLVPVQRHGYVWVPGHYEWRAHRRVFIEGGYVARGRVVQPDRDRDGVPNRYDRFPNNPYRS